jgi:adenosylmethionine-8-amino-7-oxononanoate aminotransferase
MHAHGWGLDSLPRIARGEGSYLYDTTGRRYLDGSGGPAAFTIDHGNPKANAAIASQLAQVACGYRYLFGSEPLEELTHLLLTEVRSGQASNSKLGRVTKPFST